MLKEEGTVTRLYGKDARCGRRNKERGDENARGSDRKARSRKIEAPARADPGAHPANFLSLDHMPQLEACQHAHGHLGFALKLGQVERSRSC
jgi:hypothetical protein